MSSRNSGLWAVCGPGGRAVRSRPALAQTARPPTIQACAATKRPARLRPARPTRLPDLVPAPTPAPRPDATRAEPRRKRSDLPPLTPYRGAERAGLRGGVDPTQTPPAPTVAALPAPPPRRDIKREDKPFDPVGLYVGNLKLTPYIEQDVGYASNPLGISSGAKGSALSTTEIGVGLQSNWSRNELTGSAKLGYNDYFQTPEASAPYGSGVVDYRYDASRDLCVRHRRPVQRRHRDQCAARPRRRDDRRL